MVTGDDDGRKAWRPSKRAVPNYNQATRGDDAPVGRLVDSSARFFATPEENKVSDSRVNR